MTKQEALATVAKYGLERGNRTGNKQWSHSRGSSFGVGYFVTNDVKLLTEVMSKTNRFGKVGANLRRKNELKRLEQRYEAFKAAHKDKEPWTSTRNCRKVYHAGRSYDAEVKRLEQEIAHLKAKITVM